MTRHANFGRNIEWAPRHYYEPATEAELLEIMNQHRSQQIRCVGRRHSWSRLLEANDVLINLCNLNRVEPDDDPMQAQVGAGCQVKRLLSELDRQRGWTLPSVGFITEQSIAGAIATGTHGSGRHSLSHYVKSVRIARFRGEGDSREAFIEEVTDGDLLLAARCSLGCLGVIVSVTMECRAKYHVEEHFQEYWQLDDVLEAEDAFPLQQFYLVPWRWSYFAQHRRESTQPSSKSAGLYRWYRFLALDIFLHLFVLLVARVATLNAAAKGLFRWVAPAFVIRGWRAVGPANLQLVMEHELFRHVEIELFVQRPQLHAALEFLQQSLEWSGTRHGSPDDGFRQRLADVGLLSEADHLRGNYCHHYPICVRKILPDATLMSMASTQGCEDATSAWYSITLTNYYQGSRRQQFELFATFLAKSMARLFGARPHWGKLCPLTAPELWELYPAFRTFCNLRAEMDPDDTFTNDWTAALMALPERVPIGVGSSPHD